MPINADAKNAPVIGGVRRDNSGNFKVRSHEVSMFSSHFCRGHLPVAFVFSVPGKEEQNCGKPIAGDTGENLNSALAHLHKACPALFSSLRCYDYRITNAFAEPIAVGLGHSNSEAKDSEIRNPQNIARVLRELSDCNLVILCGGKAKLLLAAVKHSGKSAIVVPHVGNKGLNGKFSLSLSNSVTPKARRQLRVELWAKALLKALKGTNKA
jgi:uracil-DNA glycosylase